MSDKELIYLCAFRYALGRKTYIVSVITDWLKLHSNELCKQAKLNMIKEINNPLRGSLGDNCDKTKWFQLRDYFIKELENETN